MGGMQNQQWSVIIPSFHSKALTKICVKSFEHFCPNWLQLNYVVVENSNDDNYLHEFPNVTWVNDPSALKGSEGNASALEKGIFLSTTEWIFMAHCDVCVTNKLFFTEINKKKEEGFLAIGMLQDKHPDRIHALHILGLLVKKSLLKDIDIFPRYQNGKQILDVGDAITEHCRNQKIPYFCFKNTYNNPDIIHKLNERYKHLNCPRCISEDGTVIYLHLSRGISKLNKTYKKLNRINIDQWKNLCKEITNES